MANLNFSSVPSRDPLAEGIYLMNIEAAEEKKSSTGKDMLLVRFKEPETGVAVFENYVLQTNCLWKLQELCNAIGIDTSSDMDTADLIPQLIGQTVKVKVTREEYEGQINNRAKKVFAC